MEVFQEKLYHYHGWSECVLKQSLITDRESLPSQDLLTTRIISSESQALVVEIYCPKI